MSQDTNSHSTVHVSPNECPTCHQPWNNSPDDGQLCQPCSALKRQQGERAQLPQSKKLRSSDDIPDGRFKSPLVAGSAVWVNAFVPNKNERYWIPGRVRIVHKPGEPDCTISVEVQDEDGEWGLPPTINKHNSDPIPYSNMPGNDEYNRRDYIRSRVPGTEKLSPVELKQYQCMEYFSGKFSDSEKVTEQEQDIIGHAILNDDPTKLTSMRNLVYSMMVNEDVKRVVKIATGIDECSAQHALAFLVGQFCGIKLSETDKPSKDIDPKELLDEISSNDNTQCPISRVFLMSAMCARTHKRKKFDPSAPLYDY